MLYVYVQKNIYINHLQEFIFFCSKLPLCVFLNIWIMRTQMCVNVNMVYEDHGPNGLKTY